MPEKTKTEPATKDGITLKALKKAIEVEWGRDTSTDYHGWSRENHSLGQCAVTALVVQDYFGGTLKRVEVWEGGKITRSHYYNELPDGTTVDLTKQQFKEGVELRSVIDRTREYVLSNPDTALRYRLLSSRVKQAITEEC